VGGRRWIDRLMPRLVEVRSTKRSAPYPLRPIPSRPTRSFFNIILFSPLRTAYNFTSKRTDSCEDQRNQRVCSSASMSADISQHPAFTQASSTTTRCDIPSRHLHQQLSGLWYGLIGRTAIRPFPVASAKGDRYLISIAREVFISCPSPCCAMKGS
jgi:hypothetical protein